MSLKKKSLFIITAALIVCAAALVVFAGNKNASAAHATPVTYTVQTMSGDEVIDVSGNIEPIESANLGFEGSGKIRAVHVAEGSRVRAGTLLAELDDIEQRYELASIDNQLEKARISGSRHDLGLLELQRAVKQANLDDRRLFSTLNGVVTAVNGRAGEYTKSIDSITTLVRVIDDSAMKATVEVDEIDASRLRTGQRVRFFFDAFPELDILGRVSSIPIEGRVTASGIAVLDVELVIDQPPPGMVSGFSFSAQILVSEDERFPVVDSNAVIERNGRSFVLLAPSDADGRPEQRAVTTARLESGRLRILSGLSGGETLIIPQSQQTAAGTTDTGSPLSLFGIRTPTGSGPAGGPGGMPPAGGPPPGLGFGGGGSGSTGGVRQ